MTLDQTVSGLNTSATYLLDFWTSGEDIGGTEFTADGFFGLQITGESLLYFAAPSGNGPIGNSQRYQIYFTPATSTVTFSWINWGHYNGPGGLSDELVLDDVILNEVEVPEPGAITIMVAMGACLLLGRSRKIQAHPKGASHRF